MDDRRQDAGADDVDALTARVAALEAENARLRASDAAQQAPSDPRRRRPGRSAAVVALLVAAGLLAPVAVVATWARDLVTDTDRYLATVGPLARDPQIRSAVTERVTTAVVEAVDVPGLAADATGAVTGLGLPPRVAGAVDALQGPLVSAVTGFVRQTVARVVDSDGFATVWDGANRAVHAQLAAALRGDPDALATIGADGTLTVDLTDVVVAVRAALSDAGFTVVDRLPTIGASFPLLTSADLVRAQGAYRLLDVLGAWLVWVVLGLLVAAVLAARHRSRAVVAAGLALAGGMLLLGVALTVGRQLYARALPPAVQRPDAAVAVYDQVVTLLRVTLRSGLALGLLVAAVAFVAGGSAPARALRASWSRAAGLAAAGDRRGVGTGRAGVWLAEQRTTVRVVVAGAAAVALVLPDHLTPGYVAGVAVVAVVVLAVAGLAARPAAPPRPGGRPPG
ncbi:hypothetical protein [Cellulomonas sp. NPDC058312]|uniref:hypothetical protein n=1 Tax=Cellulomonas sp. NPDC058312 TaxID=3346441 RepID=UPI0036E17DA9